MEQAPKPVEAPKPKSRAVLYAIIVIVLIAVGAGVYFLFQPKSTPTPSTTINMYDNGPTCTTAAMCGFNNSTNHNVTIAVHTSVTWKNIGQAPHSATSCDSSHSTVSATCPTGPNSGGPSWDTGILNAGSSWGSSVTFDTVGTYYYYCSVHSFMHGAIIVHS